MHPTSAPTSSDDLYPSSSPLALSILQPTTIAKIRNAGALELINFSTACSKNALMSGATDVWDNSFNDSSFIINFAQDHSLDQKFSLRTC